MADARLRRWRWQSLARELLPSEGVAHCLRRRIPGGKKVGGQHVPETGSGHYCNLVLCNSVWTCAICAGIITEKRRDELEQLVKAHIAAGGSVYLATYTIRHDRYDDLAPLLASFLKARHDAQSGRQAEAMRERYHICGSITALEVTVGEATGWHPHNHVLLFVTGELDVVGYEREARAAWEHAAARNGLGMNEHGFRLDRTFGAVGDYIAKYGHEPAASSSPWGVEAELVKNHLKAGRGGDRYTPFGLLGQIEEARLWLAEAELAEQRDEEMIEELWRRVAWLGSKFREYAFAFKGRKQLHCSRGLKDRYKLEEKTDEQLLQEHKHQALTLIEFEDKQWEGVLGNDVRGELTEELRSGSPGRVLSYLEELGIKVFDEQYIRFEGWTVQTAAGPGVVQTVSRCPVLERWRCSVLLEAGGVWCAYDLKEVTVLAAPPEDADIGVDDSGE